MENPIRTLLFELFVEPALRVMQRAFDRNRVTGSLLPQETAEVYVHKDET